jgi:hypothetical protein
MVTLSTRGSAPTRACKPRALRASPRAAAQCRRGNRPRSPCRLSLRLGVDNLPLLRGDSPRKPVGVLFQRLVQAVDGCHGRQASSLADVGVSTAKLAELRHRPCVLVREGLCPQLLLSRCDKLLACGTEFTEEERFPAQVWAGWTRGAGPAPRPRSTERARPRQSAAHSQVRDATTRAGLRPPRGVRRVRRLAGQVRLHRAGG